MTNRFWQLNARPEGRDFAAALALVESPVPEPGPGEVLIRNHWISMDAGTRMWMTDRTDGYQPPLPLGSPMTGLVLGRIAQSGRPGFAEGQLVRAFGIWGDYSCVDAEMAGVIALDENIADVRDYFGVLGMNGWTALWGVEETGAAKTGETVLVSAAAGATGLLACQIAKLLGCRVYGIAGGPDKCRYLTETLGIDGAIDYKAGDVAGQLAAIDSGVDVYFENVGGPILDDVLMAMNHYGRIAVCGLIADYAPGAGRTRPRHFDQVLMRRLRIEGFFSPDFMDQGPRLTVRLKDWLDAGEISLPFDETEGLDNILTAYGKLFSGSNIGKVIVELDQ